ncbi:hypothetical protein PoB_001464100 [Plakobranchus ocellatus]|uniref:Uncharacterized protein n=1 Tax=Plakobranchus ocellatus TaxID=259542 RepID=A0AAV3Z0P0_9GAST|nr:hypothetical protein PoB_001464100 [Plakobranchus ocellatus]
MELSWQSSSAQHPDATPNDLGICQPKSSFVFWTFTVPQLMRLTGTNLLQLQRPGLKSSVSHSIDSGYHTSVDYSDAMIQGVLIRRLNDEEIWLNILGESRQDISVEDALR